MLAVNESSCKRRHQTRTSKGGPPMKPWQLVALIAAGLGLSCGTTASGPSTPFNPGSTQGSGGSGSSANGAGGSSSGGGPSSTSGGAGSNSSSSGSAVGAGTGGAGTGGPAAGGAGSADASDPNTVTITMGSFTVPPNQEVFMCQDFDNPFGGVDAAIGTSESD